MDKRLYNFNFSKESIFISATSYGSNSDIYVFGGVNMLCSIYDNYNKININIDNDNKLLTSATRSFSGSQSTDKFSFTTGVNTKSSNGEFKIRILYEE